MTNKKRVEKLEDRTVTSKDIIDEIEIEFINPDGTSDSKIVSKLIDGKWTKYEKQA